MNRLYTFLLLGFLLQSCQEDFVIEQNTNTQFNVRVNGVELPVLVKGNTASKKIIVYVNGGPGLPVIEEAQLDLMNFKSIEENYAIAYYDQRGTGNSQGVIKKGTLTLAQYNRDLKDIITVLKVKYDQPQIFIMSHSFGGLISAFHLLENENNHNISGWINIDGTVIVNENLEWNYRHEFLVNIANEEISLGQNVDYWNNVITWSIDNPVIKTDQQKAEWRNFLGEPGQFIIPEEKTDLKTKESMQIIFNSSYNVFPAYLSRNSKMTGSELYENVKGSNLLPELSRLDLPCLFLWGRYDDLIPPELGQDALNEMGTPVMDQYFKIYFESNHQPYINESQVFSQDVINFVNKY